MASVLIAAVTFAFRNAVACWLLPLPADWIAELTAVARVFASVTPVRFTATVTVLPPEVSENPGPVKVKFVVLLEIDAWLVALVRMFCTLVVLPVPISVPALPDACTPERPRLLASTVARLRSTETLPLVVSLTPPEACPPPMKTLKFFASDPPWFNPMDCAWRLISLRTL